MHGTYMAGGETMEALTGKEQQLFKRLAAAFPFLSDLLHAELRVYLRTQEEAAYLFAGHCYPHTFYLPRGAEALGTIVHEMEEPLVSETFRTGKSGRGKREWQLGKMLDMFTFGIREKATGRVFAVLNFETDLERLALKDYDRLQQAGMSLLGLARSTPNAAIFRPILPQTGIIVADATSRIVFSDSAARRIYRTLGVGSLKGRRIFDQLLRHVDLRETTVSNEPWQKEIQAAGLSLVRRELVTREGGAPKWYVILLTDVTETRKKDEELRIQAAVIAEIHHRVKNNLQMIASLLRLQARRAASEEVRAALAESIDRILSISVVHEYLSQQTTETIDVQEVLENILALVARSMAAKDFAIETEYIGTRLILPSKCASSLALVLNELVLNSMEHGFAGRTHGKITLHVSETAEAFTLLFANDGASLPENFGKAARKSLGLTIIKTLVEGDLAGTVVIKNRKEGGVATEICIPRHVVNLVED